MNKNSPDYLSAVAALQKLSIDERVEAASDALKEDMRPRDAKLYPKPQCWSAILGKRRVPQNIGDQTLPGDDHVEWWGTPDKHRAWISHPYGLTLHTLRDMVRIADEQGFDFLIDAWSWYYPLHTLQVRWVRNGAELGSPVTLKLARP